MPKKSKTFKNTTGEDHTRNLSANPSGLPECNESSYLPPIKTASGTHSSSPSSPHPHRSVAMKGIPQIYKNNSSKTNKYAVRQLRPRPISFSSLPIATVNRLEINHPKAGTARHSPSTNESTKNAHQIKPGQSATLAKVPNTDLKDTDVKIVIQEHSIGNLLRSHTNSAKELRDDGTARLPKVDSRILHNSTNRMTKDDNGRMPKDSTVRIFNDYTGRMPKDSTAQKPKFDLGRVRKISAGKFPSDITRTLPKDSNGREIGDAATSSTLQNQGNMQRVSEIRSRKTSNYTQFPTRMGSSSNYNLSTGEPWALSSGSCATESQTNYHGLQAVRMGHLLRPNLHTSLSPFSFTHQQKTVIPSTAALKAEVYSSQFNRQALGDELNASSLRFSATLNARMTDAKMKKNQEDWKKFNIKMKARRESGPVTSTTEKSDDSNSKWGLARMHFLFLKTHKNAPMTSMTVAPSTSTCKMTKGNAANNEVLKVVKRIMQRNRKLKVVQMWRRAFDLVCTIHRISLILAERSYEREAQGETFLDIAVKYASLDHSSHSRVNLFLTKERQDLCNTALSRDSRRVMMAPPETRTVAEIRKALADLQGLDAFCSFPLSTQYLLTSQGSYQYISQRRVIIKKGQVATQYYFILSGLAQAIKSRKVKGMQGRCTDVLLSQGDSFGQEAILDGRPHQYSVISHEPVHLLSIPAVHFGETIKRDAEIPPNIRYLREMDWMKYWPIQQLRIHPSQSFMFYARDRQVIVMDSFREEYLYVVKSGQCVVLMKVFPGVEKSKEEDKSSFVFPSRKAFYNEQRSSLQTLQKATAVGKIGEPLQESFDERSKPEQLQTHTASDEPPPTINSLKQHSRPGTQNGFLGCSSMAASNKAEPNTTYTNSMFRPWGASESAKWSFNKHKSHRLRRLASLTPRHHFPYADLKKSVNKRETVWQRRIQYQIPKQCLPHPPHSRRASCSLPVRSDSPRQSLKDEAGKPTFYAIRTLSEGDVFGFDNICLPLLHILQAKPDVVSLVSCGAEVIALQKRFFLHHADWRTQQLVFNYLINNTLPSYSQVWEIHTQQLAINRNLKEIADKTLEDISRIRKHSGLFFHPELLKEREDYIAEIKLQQNAKPT